MIRKLQKALERSISDVYCRWCGRAHTEHTCCMVDRKTDKACGKPVVAYADLGENGRRYYCQEHADKSVSTLRKAGIEPPVVWLADVAGSAFDASSENTAGTPQRTESQPVSAGVIMAELWNERERGPWR